MKHNVDIQNISRQNVDRENADQTVLQNVKKIFVGTLPPTPSIYQLRYFVTSSPPLSFAPIIMKDAQCAESDEKLIFRFLFFELS